MNAIDPRELSDRQLFIYLVFGDLPTHRWSRALAIRAIQVALLVVFVILLLVIACVAITLIWAMGLHR